MNEPKLDFSKDSLNILPTQAQIHNEYGDFCIRLAGSYITKLELLSKKDNKAYSILYSDIDVLKPKINASHPMCPVGKYDGLGGQHGFPRWINYQIKSLSLDSLLICNSIVHDGLIIMRSFNLDKNGLLITSTIKNKSNELVKTSLGEHLYFNLNQSINSLLFNKKNINEYLNDQNASKKIMNGQAIHSDVYSGLVIIDFTEYSLCVEAKTNKNEKVNLSFWHREHTKSICFEPTVGYIDNSNVFNNKLVSLKPDESLALFTKIKLI